MLAKSYVQAMTLDPDSAIDRPLRAAKVLTAHGALGETRRLVDRQRGEVRYDCHASVSAGT